MFFASSPMLFVALVYSILTIKLYFLMYVNVFFIDRQWCLGSISWNKNILLFLKAACNQNQTPRRSTSKPVLVRGAHKENQQQLCLLIVDCYHSEEFMHKVLMTAGPPTHPLCKDLLLKWEGCCFSYFPPPTTQVLGSVYSKPQVQKITKSCSLFVAATIFGVAG